MPWNFLLECGRRRRSSGGGGDTPTLTLTSGEMIYQSESAPPVYLDEGLTVSGFSSVRKVTLAVGYGLTGGDTLGGGTFGDVLSSQITPENIELVAEFGASDADWQAALRSVYFENTTTLLDSTELDVDTRTVDIEIYDGSMTLIGAEAKDVIFRHPTAYVDSSSGNDLDGAINDESHPFQTIEAAAAALYGATSTQSVCFSFIGNYGTAHTEIGYFCDNSIDLFPLNRQGVLLKGNGSTVLDTWPLCRPEFEEGGNWIVTDGIATIVDWYVDFSQTDATQRGIGRISARTSLSIGSAYFDGAVGEDGATGAVGPNEYGSNGADGVGGPGEPGQSVSSTGVVGDGGGTGYPGFNCEFSGPITVGEATSYGGDGGGGGQGGDGGEVTGGDGGAGDAGFDDGMETPADGYDGGNGGIAESYGGDGGSGGTGGNGGTFTLYNGAVISISGVLGGAGGAGGAAGNGGFATAGVGGAGGAGVNGGNDGLPGLDGTTDSAAGNEGAAGSSGSNGSVITI